MNKMNAKQWCIVGGLLIMLVVLVCTCGLYDAEGGQVVSASLGEAESLVFSHSSGFYNEDFILEVSDERATSIYYTLNGSTPSKENPNAFLYRDGIEIACEDIEQIYNIKIVSYYTGEETSGVVCRSFITGKNVNSRYDLQVLNVFGDPDDFYNFEDGIMVHGKLDEEFIEANPHMVDWIEAKTVPVYGNFYQKGRNSEKPVFVTLFDEKGQVLVEQNCGFRLYGGYSRSKNQPSFRLYARSEYDVQNDFDYIFFDNQYKSDGTLLLDKYQRLVVRNNGNDNGYAFIRNELSTRLAIDAGFPEAQASTPVCVYLNGEYYGVLWLMANFDDEYFEQTYGEYEGEMYIFEGKVNSLEVEDDVTDEAYIALAEEYDKNQTFFATCDLNEEANWKALNEFIDVENYIHYMAIQHYIANNDTLVNNYRIYRYYDANDNYIEGTVFDGKYRFLLFDLDYSFGLMEYHRYVPTVDAFFTSERMTSEAEEHKLFANIMSREDCRGMYIRYFLSCMNYYYSESYVTPILEELHEMRYNELQYAISQGLFLNNFCAEDVTDMAQVEAEMNEMRVFMEERPSKAFYDLVKAFGAFTPYSLILQNDSLATVQIDYADVTLPSLSGIYLVEVPPVLKAQPRVGWKFSHWLVNGEEIYSEEFCVEETMVQDYVMNVACVCVPDEEAGVEISAVKPKGSKDYIELTNFGIEAVNLGDYSLSDTKGEHRSPLPAITLLPQESIIIYCENYTGAEALGKPGTNFNVSVGETISLYDKAGSSVSEVVVPELGSANSIFKLDPQTGTFKEII